MQLVIANITTFADNQNSPLKGFVLIVIIAMLSHEKENTAISDYFFGYSLLSY